MSVAYVKVRYRSRTTGHQSQVIQGVLTKYGLLLSLLQYHSEAQRGASSQAAINLSVKLLLQFVEHSNIPFHTPVELLKAFRYSLDHGTVDWTMDDPTGLFWKPRKRGDVNRIVNNLTNYTDWLTRQPDHSEIALNPIRDATSYEQKLNWCAYHHRKNNSLLKHLSSDAETKGLKYTREVNNFLEDKIILEEVKRFPASRFNELIEKGFINPKICDPSSPNYMDYKSQAMAYLMHYGGIRESELFHIYLSDVGIDKERKEAVIRIYHPSEGAAPETGYSNREDYLKRKFGLKPRTNYLKTEKLHSGWKNPVLDHTENYMEIDFFPPSKAAEFLIIFQLYLVHQRVEPKRNWHPFAFTNKYGEPETRKNFRRRHIAAVRRIGLESSKLMGTTEHGHRHAYGYRLFESGFDQIVIQKKMHHRSKDSCLVYIQKTNSEIRAMMRETEHSDPDLTLPMPDVMQQKSKK